MICRGLGSELGISADEYNNKFKIQFRNKFLMEFPLSVSPDGSAGVTGRQRMDCIQSNLHLSGRSRGIIYNFNCVFKL